MKRIRIALLKTKWEREKKNVDQQFYFNLVNKSKEKSYCKRACSDAFIQTGLHIRFTCFTISLLILDWLIFSLCRVDTLILLSSISVSTFCNVLSFSFLESEHESGESHENEAWKAFSFWHDLDRHLFWMGDVSLGFPCELSVSEKVKKKKENLSVKTNSTFHSRLFHVRKLPVRNR